MNPRTRVAAARTCTGSGPCACHRIASDTPRNDTANKVRRRPFCRRLLKETELSQNTAPNIRTASRRALRPSECGTGDTEMPHEEPAGTNLKYEFQQAEYAG